MWLPSVLKRVTYYFGSGRGGAGEEEPKEVTYAAFAFLMSSSVSTG